MFTGSIIALVVLALLGISLLFIILRHTARIAMRLALFGLALLVLAVGALVVWWYVGPDAATPRNENRPSNNRPARPR